MRRRVILYAIFSFSLFCITASAQIASKAVTAKQLLSGLTGTDRPSDVDMTAMKLSVETYSIKSGVSHVYFQQQVNGIPVYNAIMGVHVTRDNKLLTHNSRFVSLKGTESFSAAPVLTQEQAVMAAVTALKLRQPGPLVRKQLIGGTVQEVVFDKGVLAAQDIRVQLVYQPMEKMGLRLTWQVEIYTANGKDWWLARIDAQTGELLDKNNYVVSCDFGIPTEKKCTHNHINKPGVTGIGKPGVPDMIKRSENPSDRNINASYRVYPYPVETPNHTTPAPPADGRTTVSSPAVLTASPFGWHDTNGVLGGEFTTTQGNNVHAYTDIDANNTPDAGSSPDGGPTYVFVFPLDLTQAPSTYRPAAVTNLFYWNNFIHDFMHGYGFDEAGGNFQENNYGNGGLGSDYVNAEAQDGSGTNNANFGTPPDGQNPRMQMYIGTNPTPDVDGDFDNGVIVHEYGHGISNRLTGGPATTSCLNNSEQMGEGWSDWYALMLTMKPTDVGITARGIGTYLFGQPANGPGIRPTPYSTNMAVNPTTYGNIGTLAVPHGVGYAWATMLWDLTWKLIETHGYTTGFNLAMQLVTDGLKLQPCSPGFVDGRNAIIAADQALTSGANRCLIWEVFARRGLGFSASQGSSSSTTDGTQAFDIPSSCFVDLPVTTISVCQPANAVLTVNVGDGFTGNVTLSATGNPAGTTVSFSPNPVASPGSSTLTVGNTGAAAPGTYTVTVTGSDGSQTHNNTFSLTISGGIPGGPTLVTPANGAVNQINPLLTWNAIAGADTYDVQVATDPAFTTIVASATGLTSPSYQTTGLTSLTTYYWRSRAISVCGTGAWASAFSFTTANIACNTYTSTNVPVVISTSGTPTITSTIVIPACVGTISSLKVKNLNIAHTWVGDLRATLTSPTGTIISLFDRPGVPATTNGCANDNLALGFDDAAILTAANLESTCSATSPAIGGTYQSITPLAGLVGQVVEGTWTLTVSDLANLDGGSLNSWELEICYAPCGPVCDVVVNAPTITQPDCSTPTGTIVVNATGTGTLEYSTDGGTSYQASNTFSGLTPGNYNIMVRQQANPACAVAYSSNPVVINPAPVAATVSCPANITANNATGQCGNNVTYSVTSGGSPAPTLTYSFSGATTGTGAGTGSGSFFSVGTTTVTVTATNTCGSVNCSFTIIIVDTEPPTITCPANIELCGSQAVNYSATASDNCPGTTISYSPASGSVFAVGTTTVTATATDASGNTASCSFTVKINPIPTVNTVPNQAVCNGAPTAAVNFTGTVPGTIYNWTNNTPSIGLAASGTGNIGSFNAINTGTAPVTATVTVTPTTNSASFSQTFNHTGAVQTWVVPAGVTSINIQAFGAQGNANAAGVALGGLGGSASGVLTVTPGETLNLYVGGGGSTSVTGGFNGGGNGGTTGTCATAPGGGGGGASDIRQGGTALSNRVIVAGGGGGTAGNRVASCARGAGGGGGGGYFGGGGGSGYPGIAGVVPGGGTQLAGGTGGVTGTTFGATNGAAGAAGQGGNGGNEIASAQAGSQAITFSSGNGGGTTGAPGSQSGANNFTGQGGAGGSSYTGGVTGGSTSAGVRSGNGAITISYTLPITPVICTGTPTSFTITVNPTPNAVAAPVNQTVCSGATITPITISGNVSGTTFNWIRNNTATVTGIAASGSGNITGALTNTTNAPVVVAFTITPVANGCSGTPVTVNVTVNPTATVNAVPDRTVCNGSTVATTTFSSPTTGGTIVYNWTNSNTAIGLGASGTGNLPSFTATNATTAPISGTITVTPTYTNGVTCVGTPRTFVITVAPTPTVDPVANQTVCNGSLTAPVNFTSPVAGTSYTWTNNTTSIGLAASGTGNIAAFTATNTTVNPVTATVTVTPNYTVGSPGSITLPPQSGTFTGNVRGYWFTAPTSFTMTSLFVPTDASTGNQSIAVVRFNGATPPPVFAATTNAFSTLFLTQNNTTAGPIAVSIPITAGDVIGIMGYRGTVNSYSAGPNTITIAGLPATLTRMGMQFPLTTTAPQQLWQEPTVASVSRVLFDYTTAVSCPGPQRSFTITVNPTPTITCPANITVPSVVGACNTAVSYSPTVTGTPTPTLSYSFSGATTGSGSGSGSGSLFNVGVTRVTVTATNICGTVSCSFDITVTDSQLPVITAQPQNRTVCAGSNATFSVTAITSPSANGPLSYQWQQWNGTAWVNVSGATASSYTINGVTQVMNTNTFRVVITGLCTTINSGPATLTVNPLPSITLNASPTASLLPNQTTTLTATVNPTGGSFVWSLNGSPVSGATGNTLGPIGVNGIGAYQAVYTDPNGCVSASAILNITAQPSGGIWVYPVPNTGTFNVRFYNQTGEQATLQVFNAIGQIIYSQKLTLGIAYSNTVVNLGDVPGGVYIVKVVNSSNLELAAKRIVVYHP